LHTITGLSLWSNMPADAEFDLTAIAKQAMIERGFIPDFSPAIQKQTQELKSFHSPLQNGFKDLRHWLWFSIDNDDSRDLDQLTYAENLGDGKHRIYIAVAYVSGMVRQGDAIDGRAAHNTTSVYTPTVIFPMLPEELSTNLTSLNPGEDREALIFEGTLSSQGVLEEYAIYPAKVHNHAKLAYDSTSQWLDNASSPPPHIAGIPGLTEQVRLQDKIASQIALYRQSLGALSFETIEAQPVFAQGIPVAIKEVQKNRGRLLIENFMIVANTISAQFADKSAIISLRRIVIVPKRWDKIVDIARELGYRLPAEPDSASLERFVQERKKADPLRFPDLSLTLIKLLGKGEYVVSIPGKPSPGHFGLAVRDYSHSTAPNRRFPDLITQRLLFAALTKQPSPYNQKQLQDLAAHCTQKEDDAEKVERRTKKSAAAMVLSKDIGQEFDGIVTGASEKGTWVRILNPPVEGKLVKGAKNADVGDRIRVKLVHTDVQAGFIDFIRI
jgi:exoribonuclease II